MGAGFAFSLHAQTSSSVHAGRNAQLDDSFLLDASLTAAFGAALFDNLAGALASRASARDGEKSLLISELAASRTSLASDYSGAGFRSRAVAGGAKFLARDFDFGVYTGRGFFKRQTHVVAQIGTTARTPAAPPAAPPAGAKILEAEKVSE